MITSLPLSSRYANAKKDIEPFLSPGSRIMFGDHSGKSVYSGVVNFANIDLFVTDPDYVVAEDKAHANMFIEMEVKFTLLDKCHDKHMQFVMLCSAGDTRWNVPMINKIWGGNYPASVAIDADTGDVYFVTLNAQLMMVMFTYISTLTDSLMNAVQDGLNTLHPYKIILDYDALFDFVSEEIGLRELRDHAGVELDVGTKCTITRADEEHGLFVELRCLLNGEVMPSEDDNEDPEQLEEDVIEEEELP